MCVYLFRHRIFFSEGEDLHLTWGCCCTMRQRESNTVDRGTRTPIRIPLDTVKSALPFPPLRRWDVKDSNLQLTGYEPVSLPIEVTSLVDADTVGLPALQPCITTEYAFMSPCIPERASCAESNRILRANGPVL